MPSHAGSVSPQEPTSGAGGVWRGSRRRSEISWAAFQLGLCPQNGRCQGERSSPCRPILVLIARGDWREARADEPRPACDKGNHGPGIDEIAWVWLLVGKACPEVVMTPDKIKPVRQTCDGSEQTVDEICRILGVPRTSNHRRLDAQSVGDTGGILWCG